MDNLSDIYKEVSKYDLHYSTVRTTVTTFLVSLSLSLGFFLLKENLNGAVLFLPVILLTFAFLLSAHYERLTNSCRKIQEELEDRISCRKCRKTPLLNFRQRLAEQFRKSKFIHWDIVNIVLFILTVGYFLFVIHHNVDGIHIVVSKVENTAGVYICQISSLGVTGDSGKVMLTWQEKGDSNGFILPCSEKGKDNYTPITCLIPYVDKDNKDILLYWFTDSGTKRGAKYNYRLEIIEHHHKGDLKIWKLDE